MGCGASNNGIADAQLNSNAAFSSTLPPSQQQQKQQETTKSASSAPKMSTAVKNVLITCHSNQQNIAEKLRKGFADHNFACYIITDTTPPSIVARANLIRWCNLLERCRINMRDMLPESERQDALLLQVLEDRRLAYLCSHLKLRVELLNKLSSSSVDSNELLLFVEDQTKIYDKNTQLFIQTLVSCIYETAISPTLTSLKTDKTTLNQEKIFIENHRQCLQTYIKTIEQQVWALYALQLIGYKNNFPKELLLRLFVYSYDLDIIEEDAYFKWKEDINDDIPGKGKALFQVSKWLQWLEHASEESDDDKNDDNRKSQEIILNDKENGHDQKNIEQEQNT
ncbi:unnamed protein product [Rotaria sp. Silwood2]|nr:unnamed protein product [Rotaria sp. Silwood2]